MGFGSGEQRCRWEIPPALLSSSTILPLTITGKPRTSCTPRAAGLRAQNVANAGIKRPVHCALDDPRINARCIGSPSLCPQPRKGAPRAGRDLAGRPAQADRLCWASGCIDLSRGAGTKEYRSTSVSTANRLGQPMGHRPPRFAVGERRHCLPGRTSWPCDTGSPLWARGRSLARPADNRSDCSISRPIQHSRPCNDAIMFSVGGPTDRGFWPTGR
ncbi:hypothetical protein SAMN05421849_1309 [Pontibaca methylaminivorans]|uniref:Uncharacterized protein n=1 Tax=Pontibaca methylaminivorans TaxID=515897 RepID=A0A1R3WUH8_9RHOB|nr:hypothetical protein SAMN05421849_1309 [Pontibaca methylaminivorans]